MRRPAKPPEFVPAPTSQKPFYVARLAPMQPQTFWSLENGELVEVCGKRRKAWPLASLSGLTLVGEPGSRWRAAHLMFGRTRVIIPAQNLQANLSFQDRTGPFNAFVAALETESSAAVATSGARAPSTGRRQLAQAVIWAIILTGLGAVVLIVATLFSGMTDLGLALGARLLFIPILLAAALPWLLRARD